MSPDLLTKDDAAAPSKIRLVQITYTGKARDILPGAILTHPLEQRLAYRDRDRYRYEFVNVARAPFPDRPGSGRVTVRRVSDGAVLDFYAILFDVYFVGES
jgi:hypothetical protein